MTTDQRKEFWSRISDVRTGMLEVQDRFVPMSHSTDPDDGNLWFITAKGTPMAAAADAGATCRYIVCSDPESIYADITGKLAVSNDPEKLDEVWNFVASSWFEEGKQDPDLLLVRLRPDQSELWLGPESGVTFLLEIAKAKVTGDKPNMGSHTTLSFS